MNRTNAGVITSILRLATSMPIAPSASITFSNHLL